MIPEAGILQEVYENFRMLVCVGSFMLSKNSVRNKLRLELSNLLTEIEEMPFCQGRSALWLWLTKKVAKESVIWNIFRVKKPIAPILYIVSIMSSGCEVADIVGNNPGALPYGSSEFTGKDGKCFTLPKGSNCWDKRERNWQSLKAS